MRKQFLITLILFIGILGNVIAQQRTLSGKVTSAEDGTPLPGVSVVVSGTTVGTVTTGSGDYSLKVPDGSGSLSFSFIGMKTQTIQIGELNTINVSMEMTSEVLSEVVATALGIKRETKALGFAVQEIGQEDLSASRELNVTNFLTAKVAGVQIQKTAGGSTGSSAITIRGAKSLLGNNQPLFVVDGVPITNIGHSSGGTFDDRQDLGDGVGDLNSEDVESMTVLKGPSATALYGARGSNGVILITTKTGKKRKGIGVEVNSNTSIETINQVPTFQNYYANGYEDTNIYGSFIEIPAGSGKMYETMDTWHGDTYGPPLDGRRTIVDPYVFPEDMFKKTLVLLPQPANNVRDFYNSGLNTANSIAISGGNDNTIARLSISNNTTKGIVPNWKTSKQTIVLSASSEVTDYLTFDGKVNYIHDEGNQRPYMGEMYQGGNFPRIFSRMSRTIPLSFLEEYYEKTGEPGNWPGISINPYYVLNELKNEDSKDRIIGQISATLKLAPWLSLLGRAGTDFYTQTQKRTWPVGAPRSENHGGRIVNDIYGVKDINADVILTGNKALSNKFNLNVSLGSSILYQQRDHTQLDGRNFKADGVFDIANCIDIYPYTYISKKEMQSVYATAQLAYNNYLFLDVTGRNDWSSALGKDNYSFFYPSVSASFVFTDALKTIPSNILSFGKIRGSWAQVGNDSDPYLTMNGYASTTETYAGQGLTWMNSTIPLLDLKNELTESWEIGADLRFLNNKVNLDITYYNGKTTNQIIPVNVTNASGYSNVVINAGEIQNKGIEATLGLTPVKTANGFTWEINANWSRNHSKVVSLAPGIETITIGSGGSNIIEARVGEAYGNIVGYAYKTAPDGQRIVNSSGGYVPTDAQQVLGNTTPDWIGGLNNTFTYKRLSLNILLDFVQGNEITSSTKYNETASGTGVWTTWGRRLHDIDPVTGEQLPLVGILPGVQEITDASGNITYETNTVAADGQTLWANRAWSEIGEEFVLDGSYISLREVMLSYSIKPSMLQKTPFAGITLSAVGRNLAYLEEHMQGMGISPESAPNTSSGYAGVEVLSLPTTRTWAINIKLNF